jgi:hypothetical protein
MEDQGDAPYTILYYTITTTAAITYDSTVLLAVVLASAHSSDLVFLSLLLAFVVL